MSKNKTNSNKKNKRNHSHSHKSKDANFETTNVQFPSMPNASFRVNHSLTENGSVIWVEHKTTHQQWQATFEDVSNEGPEGVKLPKDVVLAYLQAAIYSIDSATSKSEKASNAVKEDKGDDATADFETGEDGTVSLIMTIRFSNFWSSKFVFSLSPVALDQMDILVAQLRDAQEEILKLKRDNKVVYCTLGVQNTTGPNTKFNWGFPTRRYIDADYFQVDKAQENITILEGGVYQIDVTISGPVTHHNISMALHIDNQVVAHCWSSSNSGYNQLHHISDIFEIKAKSIISILWMSNYNSVNDGFSNRLTIRKLN